MDRGLIVFKINCCFTTMMNKEFNSILQICCFLLSDGIKWINEQGRTYMEYKWSFVDASIDIYWCISSLWEQLCDEKQLSQQQYLLQFTSFVEYACADQDWCSL